MAHLTLRAREFEIESAVIQAFVDDPHWCDTYNHGQDKRLSWWIEVEARPREYDGEIWKPKVYFEGLELPVRSWTDVAGQKKEWSEPYDQRTGELNGGVYVFECESITQASLIIGPRNGAQFELRWEGICDLHFDDGEYGANVPFSLEAVATFAGVTVAGSEKDTDQSILERLSAFIDVSNLRQTPLVLQPSKYEDGVGMARAKFHPLVVGA